MAKVYAPPEGLDAPKFDVKLSWDEYMKVEEKYKEDLAAWCRKHAKGDIVGKTLNTPRGDGYAQYMVCSEKPFAMIHIATGDAWRADEVWERGMNLATARKRIKQEEEFEKKWKARSEEQANDKVSSL